VPMAVTRCARLAALAITASPDGGDPLRPARRACDHRWPSRSGVSQAGSIPPSSRLSALASR
ncbi:hypothetical protein EUB03_20925, partial [Mycobacterium tuberculosis]